MPRQSAISIENNFTKGLITEATGLNFPENASTETYNCVFSHTGEVSRRPGIDYETDFAMNDISVADSAIREFLWKAVAQNGEFSFLVLQVGSTIYFFEVTGSSVSASRKDFTIDLDDFKVAGSPTTKDITCSFDSGNGYLFVAHPYCSPFYISYSSDDDEITATAITLKIRDFEGLDDTLGIDERPLTLSKEHHYNLINQGWGTITPETADNTTFIVIPLLYAWRYNFPYGIVPPAPPQSNYPSNSDIWWSFKTVMRPTLDNDGNPVFAAPVEAFSLVEVNSQKKGNTLAPRGHNILTAWFQDRSATPFFTPNPMWPYPDDGQGSLGGIPVISSGYQRPNCVAFYAGRVWWAGINSEKFNTKIYFSRILEKNKDFGQCYQDSDPTGEDAADLLPSDGGVIVIPSVAKIIKMMQMGNALYVFATNGVWKIEGSQGIGFTATDYSINKISSTPALSETSFVDVEGTPMWWNHDGIWAIQMDQAGAPQVNSLSFTTISDFVGDILSSNKRYVKAAYNPLTKVVQWIYRSDEATTVQERYQYDRLLNLSLINQAFYPWSLDDNCNKIIGIFVIQGIVSSFEEEIVTDSTGEVVTTGAGDVTVEVVTREDIASHFKYIVDVDCGDCPTMTDSPSSTSGLTMTAEVLSDLNTDSADVYFPQSMTLHGHHLYVSPTEGTVATVLKYDTNLPFTEFDTLDLDLTPPGDNPDFWCSCADDTYLYLYPAGSLVMGTTTSVLRRVLLSDFTSVDTLDLSSIGNCQPPTGESIAGKIVELNGWLYLMNVQGGAAFQPSTYAIIRVDTSDFTTIETLAISGGTVSGLDVFTDGTYIYLIGRIPTVSTHVYKIDPATFTVVSSILLYTGENIKAQGCAACGFAYIGPLVDNPSPESPATVKRIDLSTFASYEERSLGIDLSTQGIADILVHGSYLYILDRGNDPDTFSFTRVIAVNRTANDWATAPVLVLNVGDITLDVTDGLGFSAMVTDGVNLYVIYDGNTLMRLPVLDGANGLTCAEFTNLDYVDWFSAPEEDHDDFTSYFITGYKVHGDAIRKFQSNYTQLYTNNDVFSVFDFDSRWDYSLSGDTGRWSNKQRVTMDDVNYKFRSKRLKSRGHGKALQYKVTSVTGEPFNVIGWSTFETANTTP